MMQPTLSNNSAQVSLTAAPRRSVAPLGTSSPSCKRLPHRLCVAVKFGVCVCECGKVTALKASADHRFASCAAMQGFQPLFYCVNGVSDGSKWNVHHALPIVCITFCCSFASRFDPAGFHSLNFILRRKVMAYRGTARASLHSVFLAVSVPCNDAITLAFAAIRSQCHFVAV